MINKRKQENKYFIVSIKCIGKDIKVSIGKFSYNKKYMYLNFYYKLYEKYLET